MRRVLLALIALALSAWCAHAAAQDLRAVRRIYKYTGDLAAANAATATVSTASSEAIVAQAAAAEVMLETVRADGTEVNAEVAAAIDALRAAASTAAAAAPAEGGNGIALAETDGSATARAALEVWLLYASLRDAGKFVAMLEAFSVAGHLLPEGIPSADMIDPVVVGALRGALAAPEDGAASLAPVHHALVAAFDEAGMATDSVVATWTSDATPAAGPLGRVSPDALAAALLTPLSDAAAWEHSPDKDKVVPIWSGHGLAGYALYVTRRLEVGALTPDFTHHALAYLQQQQDGPSTGDGGGAHVPSASAATSADALTALIRAELASDHPSTERLVGYLEALRGTPIAPAPAPDAE